MTEILGFRAAKIAAAKRIKEARERIDAQFEAHLKADIEKLNAVFKDYRPRTEEKTLRVAKALCAAGFHEWPLTDGSGSNYNNAQEQRYWLRLAEAAIQEIEDDPR